MRTDSTPDSFDAVLQDEHGNYLADGIATISIEDQTLTFQSDFVPLYPIGTAMQVVRFHQNQLIHRFHGSVFLSDKQLMRLVSVTDIVYPGAECCYWDCQDYKGTVTLEADPQAQEKKLLHLFRPKQNIQSSFSINISAISTEKVLFQVCMSTPTQEELPPRPSDDSNILANVGDWVHLHLSSPLPSISVKASVQKLMLFGPHNRYLCSIEWENENHKETLQAFLWLKTKELCTRFPTDP